MYSKNFVVVIKCGGKILRERDGIVFIPFTSEFSILLKNLESRKAKVEISIDGEDALNGRALIVEPNDSIEIERFVDNLNSGNRFKFIQKTDKISEHRGDRVDDGLVRIEYTFEKAKPTITEDYHYHYDYSYPLYHPYRPYWPNITYTSSNIPSQTYSSNTMRGMSSSIDAVSYSTPNEDGITVKGSISQQQFILGYIGTLEPNSQVIILHLRGTYGETIINTPLTVETKLVCNTCGTKSNSNAKYCEECGTFLQIV